MREQPSILVIEDDAAINEVVSVHLRENGCTCTQAFSGSEARLLLSGGSRSLDAAPAFDLVITDLMLPGMAGEDIVRLVRETLGVPVIVLSARTAAADKVDLLRQGADDYVTKPFDLDELLARIQVQLRHSSDARERADARRSASSALGATVGEDAHAPRTLRYKNWEIDPEARELAVDGRPVRLTRLEFNIVEALARRPRKVFTKRELFEVAWGEQAAVEEKSVNVHVSNVRAKLRDAGAAGGIETVWGIGFKLAD